MKGKKNGTESGTTVKRTVRDSVFCDLFREPAYLLQLYQALHPEDTDVTERDLTDVTMWYTLSEEFFDGDGTFLDARIRVLMDDTTGDIISQYIAFTKVLGEQEKLYGRSRKAILETIRICKDRKILEEYLNRKGREVIDIMMTLFDDDYIIQAHEKALQRDARAEGRAEERAAGIVNAIQMLKSVGADKDSIVRQISEKYNLSVEETENYIRKASKED